jgi:predicted metal-binding membrane protein
VMNLLWIAALTLLVATEKLAPKGEILARVLGTLMIVAGAVRLIWRAS